MEYVLEFEAGEHALAGRQRDRGRFGQARVVLGLFRQHRFYDKRLYGLVVSGYSGGDLLARQLISALNMNKSFFLPPHFCLLETANEAGSLVRLSGVARRARAFASEMMDYK